MLLALVFETYKARVAKRAETREKERANYVKKYYNLYDQDERGYLTLPEAKKFFALILDLNYKKRKDRTAFKKIMQVVDPDDQKIVEKDNLLAFFTLSNFLDVLKGEAVGPAKELSDNASHSGASDEFNSD